jgi:CRISPR-associated protein Csm2
MSSKKFEEYLVESNNFKDVPVTSFMGNEGWAKEFMQANHQKIKMNQLRNFFNEINAIKDDFTPQAKVILETNLAYDYGRNVISKEFYEIINRSLMKTKIPEDFKNFVRLIESLIAYHKFYHTENQ